MQQASGSSGIIETYNEDLNFINNFIRCNVKNKNAKIVWHSTWAYQKDSNHDEFYKYNYNQLEMYNKICECVKEKIITNNKFDLLIPCMTSIQNVRTSYIGDTLTRDGYHLSESLGRQIASLALVHTLTGVSIDGVNTTNYNKLADAQALSVAIEAIKNAIKSPFASSCCFGKIEQYNTLFSFLIEKL